MATAKNRARKLPALPTVIHTPAGPWTVEFVRELRSDEERCHGKCNWATRTIYIDDELERTAEWLTFWHEWVHAVLGDSGVRLPKRTGYDDDPTEAVCNAIALAMVAEMRR